MKIVSIKKVGKKPVYDLSVEDQEHYVLENGVVTHNTGIMYSADNVWILGRQQDKDGKELQGYHFIINVEKSRYVKEKSKIPITVTFEDGINKWSGFLENALEAKLLGKPVQGKYERVDENGEFFGDRYKEDDIIANDAFWEEIMKTTNFKQFLKDKYSTGGAGSLVKFDEEIEDELE